MNWIFAAAVVVTLILGHRYMNPYKGVWSRVVRSWRRAWPRHK